MNALTYTHNTTPVGDFCMIIDSSDVVRASGFGDIADVKKRLPSDLVDASLHTAKDHPYQKAVACYFNGDMVALELIKHIQTGSDFYQKVWRAMSDIAAGKTESYKEIASRAGSPKAVRAAGTACGLNLLPLLVPCHRVVQSDGSLGKYLYGTNVKKWLLEHEVKHANE